MSASLPESRTPSLEEVLVAVRAAMESEFGLDPAALAPETHLLDDLDLDSIDLVDLAVTLEESTGLRLEEEELKAIRTVGDAAEVIHAGLARRGPRGA